MYGAAREDLPRERRLDCPFFNKIVQIACTDERILVLDECGSLWEQSLHHQDIRSSFRVLNLSTRSGPQDPVVKITCGKTMCVLLTRSGRMFDLSGDLHFQGDVADFQLGYEHCIILEKEGRVLTFGRGSRGQLGHGDLEDRPSPQPVEALEGIKIAKIAAGGWHSCAVSSQGDLYAWGWNGNGQLGLAQEEENKLTVAASPFAVDFPEDSAEDASCAVKNVSCGSRHTVALLDDGRAYGTGFNKYHQLAGDVRKNVYVMSDLRHFSNLDIVDIKCGPWSTALFVA